ncbi:TPA: ead/Ea22-like family protein, partial [Klebsiella pneumoniae]
MTDITELTAEKLEEIRQRYRPTLAPKCHICGVEMTIQRMSASRITYGCAGAIYDETGCHYAEGRSLADDHYAESRITVVDVSDPDVLAMVEALEKVQRYIEELREWNAGLAQESFE